MLLWSLAWWAAVGHLISGWWSVRYGASTGNWIVQQLFLVTNATLMLAGCWTFTRGPRALVAALALAVPFLAWVALASRSSLSFLQVELPGALLLASAYGLTSYRFVVLGRQQKVPGSTIIAVLFAVAALHELDYPLLRQVEGFAPFGYALAASLAAGIALCLLVMILEQARAAAQAALSEREVLAQRLRESVQDLDQKVRERTAELEKATRTAEIASRAKSEFLARMSHEIRTPLNGIIGVVELMKHRDRDREDRELLGVVRRSAASLMSVIDNVLDFSKIEAEKLQLEAIAYSPEELCEEVAELLAESAYGKGLELVVHRAPGLPSRVIGDPTRLKQVLINLTSNAVKFTPKGRIVMRASYGTGRLRFEVEDTGIGLSMEARSRVFEAFAQADSSTTRRYGGTGLGLTISQRLVELMGGELGLDSEEGVGSTFWFEVEASLAASDNPSFELDLGSKRALVCVGDAVLREALQADLESWGAACEATASLQQAADSFSGEVFDLVLCEEASSSSWIGDATDGPVSEVVIRLLPFGARPGPTSASDPWLVKPITRSRLASVLGCSLAGIARSQEEPLATGAGSRFTGCRVLLVEDESVNAMVASQMLERLGAEVEMAGNGLESIACAEKERFDLILLDCEMPEMDGYTAVVEMRRNGRNRTTPVVALTAHASARDRRRCLEAGMDDFIAKPVTFAALERILGRWFRAARADRS